MPDRIPRFDDETPLGVNFFRTCLEECELANLTLPRTFFGRSEIREVSFANTDLAESNLCWNDFTNVDFTDAVLTASDLRASLFDHVIFTRANLRNCDLRHSEFIGCDFDEAAMHGVKMTPIQAQSLQLSATQRQNMDWQIEASSLWHVVYFLN